MSYEIWWWSCNSLESSGSHLLCLVTSNAKEVMVTNGHMVSLLSALIFFLYFSHSLSWCETQ